MHEKNRQNNDTTIQNLITSEKKIFALIGRRLHLLVQNKKFTCYAEKCIQIKDETLNQMTPKKCSKF